MDLKELDLKNRVFRLKDGVHLTPKDYAYIIDRMDFADDSDVKYISHKTILEFIRIETGFNFRRRSRKDEYVSGRKLACYFLRKYTLLTFSEIANKVNVTHHTTVMHHVRDVANVSSVDPAYRQMVLEMEEKLKQHNESHNSIQKL